MQVSFHTSYEQRATTFDFAAVRPYSDAFGVVYYHGGLESCRVVVAGHIPYAIPRALFIQVGFHTQDALSPLDHNLYYGKLHAKTVPGSSNAPTSL